MAEFRTVKSGEPENVKPPRPAEGMAGLAKGLAVIEAFETASSPLTVSDAARLTGLTRASARRCLLTLTELGYLTHDGKHFRPTLRMLRLGGAYLTISRLPALAHPYLARARDALKESVSLTVWDDGWSVFVDRAESGWMLAGGVRIGARLPAYATATGRVLMAALTDAEIAAVLDRLPPQPLTPATLTDPAAITAAVEQARRDGYAISDCRRTPGQDSTSKGSSSRGCRSMYTRATSRSWRPCSSKRRLVWGMTALASTSRVLPPRARPPISNTETSSISGSRLRISVTNRGVAGLCCRGRLCGRCWRSRGYRGGLAGPDDRGGDDRGRHRHPGRDGHGQVVPRR